MRANTHSDVGATYETNAHLLPKKDAEIAVIPGNPLVLRGARNVRTLSAAFIADLQEDWEKYGTQILELMREKFPDLYFASIVKLAQIVRIEADVSLKEPKPKTIEEVLQRVEHETGVEGRRAFEGFLKKMRQDQRRARRMNSGCGAGSSYQQRVMAGRSPS